MTWFWNQPICTLNMTLKLLALCLFITSNLFAQVEYSASLMKQEAFSSIAGKRVSKRLGLWLVSVTNRRPNNIHVSRATVSGELIKRHIRVLDPEAAKLIASQERKHSPLRSTGQLITLLSFAAANLNEVEQGQELMGPTARKTLISLLPILPRLGTAIVGRAPDVSENISEMSRPDSLLLQSGQAGCIRVFSIPYSGEATVYFTTE